MRIVCRARVSPGCLDGRDARTVYENGEMHEDGTFDGTSVVCDACYMIVEAHVLPGDDDRPMLTAAVARAREAVT